MRRYYRVYYTIRGSHGFTHNKKLGVVSRDLIDAAMIVKNVEPDASIINVVHGGEVNIVSDQNSQF